jgi:hypothetical protein
LPYSHVTALPSEWGVPTIQSCLPSAFVNSSASSDQAPSTSNGSFLNACPDDHQFPIIHQSQTFDPIGPSDCLLSAFGLETERQLDASFDIAYTSSNPTSLGSPATQPVSTTFSRAPEPVTTASYGLFNSWPLAERHDDAGTCDMENRHRAECPASYSLPLPADALTQIRGESISALTNQNQHGACRISPDYCGQAQHTWRYLALMSPGHDLQEQSTIGSYDNQLRIVHYQPTDGNVALSQPSRRSSPPSAPGGPRYSISKSDSLQAELTDSKTPNPDMIKLRRQRNSAAARKYRQRRLDRIEELEQALQKTQAERDDLKVQIARWRGKAEALQSLMARLGVDELERHR